MTPYELACKIAGAFDREGVSSVVEVNQETKTVMIEVYGTEESIFVTTYLLKRNIPTSIEILNQGLIYKISHPLTPKMVELMEDSDG